MKYLVSMEKMFVDVCFRYWWCVAAGAGVMNDTYGELFSFFFADHSHQSRFSCHILNYFLPKSQTKNYAVCRVTHSTFESPPDETGLMFDITVSLCNPASESAFAVYCKERTRIPVATFSFRDRVIMVM